MYKNILYCTFILFFSFSFFILPSTLTFDGQPFSTQTWTENGISWTFTGNADIRTTGVINGTASGGPRNNTSLIADHNMNITSFWYRIDDTFNDNTFFTIKGYNSGGGLVATRTINNPDQFNTQIFLSGFLNVCRLDFTADGSGQVIRMDDMVYTDLGLTPVELVSFSAYSVKSKIQLKWQTATEINNYGFNIERSQESGDRSQNWVKIGFVNGNGNSNSIKDYSFVDICPLPGKSFYRLKQVDNDGIFEYSQIAEASFMKPDEFVLEQNYPNPFNPATNFGFQIPNGNSGLVTLTVYDMLGNEVERLVNEEKEPGNYSLSWNASGLASGIYYYTLKAGSFNSTKKLLLLK